MYLYVSPFEHTHSSEWVKLTQFNTRTELTDLKSFIKRNHRTWNTHLDYKVEKQLWAYDEENEDEFYILFSTDLPYHHGLDWSAEHTDRTNAAWFDRLLENAKDTIVVTPDYYLIAVTPWSDDPEDANTLNTTLTEVFDALRDLSEYPYLDEEAYYAAESEHYDLAIKEIVEGKGLNKAGEHMLRNSNYMDWGPNEVEYHLEEILSKETNPFWWAKIPPWVGGSPSTKVYRALRRHRMAMRTPIVQQRMPFSVYRKRPYFSTRWKGWYAEDCTLKRRSNQEWMVEDIYINTEARS